MLCITKIRTTICCGSFSFSAKAKGGSTATRSSQAPPEDCSLRIPIGEEPFMGNATLVSIDLPDSITAIRARAFKNCTSLSQMTTH